MNNSTRYIHTLLRNHVLDDSQPPKFFREGADQNGHSRPSHKLHAEPGRETAIVNRPLESGPVSPTTSIPQSLADVTVTACVSVMFSAMAVRARAASFAQRQYIFSHVCRHDLRQEVQVPRHLAHLHENGVHASRQQLRAKLPQHLRE